MTDVESAAYEPLSLSIPQDRIGKWVNLAAEEEIVLHVTRADFDNLFFAIQKLMFGLEHVRLAQFAAPESQTTIADNNAEAHRLVRESAAHLGLMMSSVMNKAEVNG